MWLWWRCGVGIGEVLVEEWGRGGAGIGQGWGYIRAHIIIILYTNIIVDNIKVMFLSN